MLKTEFESLAECVVNNSEYEIIEKVYMYHPSIDAVRGKEQVAYLYREFGIRILLDMYSTADAAAKIEREIHDTEAKLKDLRERGRKLVSGEDEIDGGGSCLVYGKGDMRNGT